MFFTSIATAIGLTGIAASVFVGIGTNLLIAAVSTVGSMLLRGLNGEAEKTSAYGVSGSLQAGGDVPRSIPLGWAATAGSFVYGGTWGTENKTPNAYMVQVIALADVPIGGLAQAFVNGELVTLLTGSVHPALGIPVSEYRVAGVDYLWVKFYDGTQVAADPYLVDKFSGSAHPYGNDRIGTNVAYVICTARVNQELFSGFPQYRFALNGRKLYDISKDSSVGGSGTHRWNNPATWGGDGDNLVAVQIYNLLRGVYLGSSWLYGLQNLPAARLPNASWIAAVNKCRQPVDGPSGPEPQYRAGGELPVSAQITEAIEGLLTASQGRLAEIGGIYKLHVGAPDAPVMAFSDDDIISTTEQSFTPFFGLADTINGISAKYPAPAEAWNTKVAPPLFSPEFEIQDGNRRLMADVSLDMVPYPGQVQRLMKSALQEARRARRLTIVVPPQAWILEPGETIELTSVRNGFVSKLFRLDGIVDQGNLDIMIDITEVDPSDYYWDQETDYRTPVDGPIVIIRSPAQPVVDWDVEGWEVEDNLARARQPALLITWDGEQDDVREVQWEVRLAVTEQVVNRGSTLRVDAAAVIITEGIVSLTEYEARIKYVPYSGRPTLWSDETFPFEWKTATTPEVKLIPGVDYDPFSGVIGIDDVSDDLKNAYGITTDPSLQGSIPQKLDQLEQLMEQLAAGVIDVMATSKQRLDILRTTLNGSNAAIIRNETAIVAEGFARAVQIQEVLASVDDVIASGFLKFEAEVDEGSASAQITAKVKASSGADFSNAAWILRAEADGLGGTMAYFGVLGDFYVFREVDGEPVPVFSANSDGTVTMRAQKVETITAGRMQSPDGKFLIDLTNKRISIST